MDDGDHDKIYTAQNVSNHGKAYEYNNFKPPW